LGYAVEKQKKRFPALFLSASYIGMSNGSLGRKAMSSDEWRTVSNLIDYVMAQPNGKPTRESPAIYGIRGEPEKPPRKPKKAKEQPPEQMRVCSNLY
jgi:hypothetical protein